MVFATDSSQIILERMFFIKIKKCAQVRLPTVDGISVFALSYETETSSLYRRFLSVSQYRVVGQFIYKHSLIKTFH